jgi:hypothetical protein
MGVFFIPLYHKSILSHMANMKFGQIVSDARGKIGGLIMFRNHSGSCLRQHVRNINKGSVSQLSVRKTISLATAAWHALTDAQRLTWEANAPANSRINNVGNTVKLSGFNLFVNCYSFASLAGIAAPTVYPAPVTLSPPTAFDIAMNGGHTTLTATFAPNVPANHYVIIRASGPKSLSRAYSDKDQVILKILPPAQGSPYDLTSDYTAIFGALPNVGEQLFASAAYCPGTGFKNSKAGAELAKAVK